MNNRTKSNQKRAPRKGKPRAAHRSKTRNSRYSPPSERSLAIIETKINPDGSSKATKFVYKEKP
jgi:hypothetical protein